MVAELPKEKVGKHKDMKPHLLAFRVFFLKEGNERLHLAKILNNDFFHHYQPIFDIQQWKIIGYEGLFRLENFKNPEATFNWAKKEKKLYELDSTSIHKALLTFRNAGYVSRKEMLFLNVFPSTVTNPSFLTLIHQLITEEKVSSQQIIFEINENEVIDFEDLKKGVHKP